MDLAELHESICAQQDSITTQLESLAALQQALADKQHELAQQKQEKFLPGQYKIILHETVVTEGESMNSAEIGELSPGHKVDVVEVKELPQEHRIRGRISHP